MTDIPYCDKTWDLTIGCKKRSPGCDNCWAIPTVHRLQCKPVRGYGFQTAGATKTTGERVWDWLPTAEVNLLDWNLTAPLHWRKPSFIFVNSKSDLFDDRVPFEFIARAFNVMCDAPEHRFMILTKEPGRMAEFIDWYMPWTIRDKTPHIWPKHFPHVILMVSVEGPEQLDRISTLMEIPAAMYGVSFEPLIEPLARWKFNEVISPCGYYCDHGEDGYGHRPERSKLDWAVVGCEKLPGGSAGRWKRQYLRDEGDPCDWWTEASRIVHACQEAGVATWVKQGPMYVMGRIVVTDDPADFPTDCRVQKKPKGLLKS